MKLMSYTMRKATEVFVSISLPVPLCLLICACMFVRACVYVCVPLCVCKCKPTQSFVERRLQVENGPLHVSLGIPIKSYWLTTKALSEETSLVLGTSSSCLHTERSEAQPGISATGDTSSKMSGGDRPPIT